MCDGCGRFKWLFSSYHGTEGIYFVDRHSEIDVKIEHLGSFFFVGSCCKQNKTNKTSCTPNVLSKMKDYWL